MHSVASRLSGLRYRIQLGGHRLHYNGFEISKKNHFFCENQGFFEVHGLHGLTQAKKGSVSQISNYTATCDVSVDFLKCGVKNMSTYTTLFFLSGHPIPTPTSKGSKTIENSLFGHLMHSIASR